MRLWIPIILISLGPACVRGVTQVAGTGAVYTTRCSADMSADGGVYTARCQPPACTAGFTAGPVSHVVVALDPGRKVVGVAERVCVQDLSRATERFHPDLTPPSTPDDGADAPGTPR